MIAIRNMEMPDSCYDCPMCYDLQECVVSDIKFTGKYKTQVKFDFCNERHPECPLCKAYEI